MRAVERSRAIPFLFPLCTLALVGCGSQGVPVITPTSSYPFARGAGYTWLQEFGGTNFPAFPLVIPALTFQTITSMATTPEGNVVAGGYTLGSFNGGSNPNQVAENCLLAYSASGQPLWSREFGTGDGDFLQGVAVDQAGNVYADGSTLGSLPGYSNSGGNLATVVYRFDSSGNPVWQKEFKVDGSYTDVTSIAVDGSGNVLLGGNYSEAGAPGTYDLYFAKLDGATGNTVWMTRFGSRGSDSLSSMTADQQGNIYASGSTTGSFPGAPGSNDINFIAKIDSTTGQADWTVVPSDGGRPVLALLGMSVRNGLLVVGGASSNSGVCVTFTPDNTARAFVAEYSTTDGSLQWTNAFATNGGAEITGVAFLSSGQVAAVGVTDGLLAPGYTPMQNNIFLLTLVSDGSPASASQFGTGPIIDEGAQYGPEVAAGLGGAVFVGGPVQTAYPGFTNTTLDPLIPSYPIPQMFIARFAR